MKKVIAILLVLCMVCSLCACGSKDAEEQERERECIGYVIIPHSDGDEHADIYSCTYSHGTITAKCMDGRKIISTNITVIIDA